MHDVGAAANASGDFDWVTCSDRRIVVIIVDAFQEEVSRSSCSRGARSLWPCMQICPLVRNGSYHVGPSTQCKYLFHGLWFSFRRFTHYGIGLHFGTKGRRLGRKQDPSHREDMVGTGEPSCDLNISDSKATCKYEH